ncbi:MAG: hypothetical protein V4580_16425 [Bacteroidota bacterium]
MRDIIWTIIIVWVVWKIYDAFKSVSKSKTQTQAFNGNHSYRKEGEVKIDKNVNVKSHFSPADGEYVDYEEVK